jgi:hypothetical protein
MEGSNFYELAPFCPHAVELHFGYHRVVGVSLCILVHITEIDISLVAERQVEFT